MTGAKKPSEATLANLAAALEMPIEFFSGDDIEEPMIDGVSFRALSTMTARQRDQAIGAAAIAMQLDDWIRARFKLPAPDVPHLRNLPADDVEHSVSNAETIAESLRNRWGRESTARRTWCTCSRRTAYGSYSLAQECSEVDAFSFWRSGVPYVFLNNYKTAEHSRMDAAHELGHLVMHAHGGPSGRLAEHEATGLRLCAIDAQAQRPV